MNPWLFGAAAPFLLACAGCSPKPVVRPPVQTVTITKVQMVPLPAQLLRPCAPPSDPAKISTNEQLLTAYINDRAGLIACASKVAAIGKLRPPSEP